jgi:hypothetical protein
VNPCADDPFGAVALLHDTAIDAYRCLCEAIDGVINDHNPDHLDPGHRAALVRALEDSTAMLSFGLPAADK